MLIPTTASSPPAWRAVDAEGEVLDVLVQTRRNKRGALKLMRKLLRKYGFVQTSWSRMTSDQGRKRRDQVDAAVVPFLCRQRGPPTASSIGLQSR